MKGHRLEKEGASPGRRFSCPLVVGNPNKRLRISFRIGIHWTCLRWASSASTSATGNVKVELAQVKINVTPYLY